MPSRDPSPFAPLPGTVPQPRALFVDLWGTLVHPPGRGYARSFEEFTFAPGAVDALFRATQAGWRIYLLGNEDAVARGLVSEEDWRGMEARLLAHLSEHGVRVDRSYVCLDDPVNGVEGRRKDSVYHLPNTGAFYHAAHTDRVELRKSWIVGDSTLELAAGWRAGVRLAGVESGTGLADRTFDISPEIRGPHLAHVVHGLLELETALHP
jgi:histidinol-phosphate phosphatase family protein